MEVIALVLILIFSLSFQSWLFGRFALERLEYGCSFSVEEAHEGDSIYLVESVYNKKLLPLPWLKVDIHSSRWLDFAGTCSVIHQDSRRVTSSFVLKGYQKITRRWKLKCLKRGVFTTENVTLVSGDLLSLRSNSIPVRVDASIIVYPEVIDLEDMFVPVNYLQSDNIVKRWIIDDPFIISGAREYLPGDPLSRIHWPATARERRLMVRKNDFTSQLGVTVLLNIQSRLYEYTDVVNKNIAELGIKAAATVLDRSLAAGAPVRLGTNGCTPENADQMIFTGEAADRGHIAGLLKILASLSLKSVKDFEVFLQERLSAMENSSVIVITSYLSKHLCEQLKQLETSGNSVTVFLLDTVYEAGAKPEGIDIYELDPKYKEKFYSHEDII